MSAPAEIKEVCGSVQMYLHHSSFHHLSQVLGGSLSIFLRCYLSIFQSSVIAKPQLTQLCIVLETWSHNQGGGRMVFDFLGSSVGTVQLMLLNLLQAVVIMADRSLLRVTKSREGTCARPPWFILCQAVHCWDDHWAYQRWALGSLRSEWEQYGHPLKCLGKNQSCLPETFIRMVLGTRRKINAGRLEENPEREEGFLPQLVHWLKANWALVLLQVLHVWCPALPVGNAHELSVLWTCVVGSANSNHWILLDLHYMLTLEILSSQSCSLIRHLLDCLQGLLEISCVLYFF